MIRAARGGPRSTGALIWRRRDPRGSQGPGARPDHYTPLRSEAPAIQLDITFTIDDITIDGDTAHVLTRSEGNVSIHENGLTAPEANRELFVFQRHDDQWKIARYMFNKTAAAGA